MLFSVYVTDIVRGGGGERTVLGQYDITIYYGLHVINELKKKGGEGGASMPETVTEWYLKIKTRT